MIRLRYADEWVGLLVVAAAAAFLGAILHAGVLRDWFRTVYDLRIVLPEAGVAGLSVGADVEVLGTRAGVIRRVVISPNQQMYAEAEIDDQARAFIRRDSQATIRRRYGIAGAAYADISRGTGPELDWSYAVIQAVTERDASESIGALIDQMRQKVFPILDDVGRSTRTLADLMDRMQRGEGNLGRLLTDETMMRDVEAIVAKVSGMASDLGQLVSELQLTAKNVKDLSQTMNARDGGLPGLLRRADATLATLQQSMRDLAAATQRAPQLVHNVELASRDLPGLLTQTQQTAHELERLAAQLRGHWLLGGSGNPTPQSVRLPAQAIRP